MKTQRTQHYTLLDELDARQDEVLDQLDELNGQIEILLSEFGAARPGEATKPLEIHVPPAKDAA